MPSVPDHILKARWLWAKTTENKIIARLSGDDAIKLATLRKAALSPAPSAPALQ